MGLKTNGWPPQLTNCQPPGTWQPGGTELAESQKIWHHLELAVPKNLPPPGTWQPDGTGLAAPKPKLLPSSNFIGKELHNISKFQIVATQQLHGNELLNQIVAIQQLHGNELLNKIVAIAKNFSIFQTCCHQATSW